MESEITALKNAFYAKALRQIAVGERKSSYSRAEEAHCIANQTPIIIGLLNDIGGVSDESEKSKEILIKIISQYGFFSIDDFHEVLLGVSEDLKKDLPPEDWNRYFYNLK